MFAARTLLPRLLCRRSQPFASLLLLRSPSPFPVCQHRSSTICGFTTSTSVTPPSTATTTEEPSPHRPLPRVLPRINHIDDICESRFSSVSTEFRAKPLIVGTPISIVLQKSAKDPVRVFASGHEILRPNRREKPSPDIAIRQSICKSKEYYESLIHSPSAYAPMTLFGHYAGDGLSPTGYAVGELKGGKHVFISSIFIHETYELIVDPEEISTMLMSPLGLKCPRLHVLPYISGPVRERREMIEFSQQAKDHDLYIEREFGVRGRGDGVLFVPTSIRAFPQVMEAACIAGRHFAGGADAFLPLIKSIGPRKVAFIQEVVERWITKERLLQAVAAAKAEDYNTDMTQQVFMQVVASLARETKEAASKAPAVDHRVIVAAVSKLTSIWYVAQCRKHAPQTQAQAANGGGD